MGRSKYLIALISIVAFLFIIAPATGRWSANWGSGSAVGSGGVTGLQKAKQNGASIQSVVAHPGAKFCSKPSGHDHDHYGDKDGHKDWDKDGCSHPDDSITYSSAVMASVNAPPPGSTPGIVFCKALNYNNLIVQGKQLVNVPSNFNGSAFIPPNAIDNGGNASFSVTNAVNTTTLNSLFNANSVCPTKTFSDDHHDDKYGKDSKDSHKDGYKDDHKYDHKITVIWTLIDFVPETFSANLQAFDSKGHLLTQAVYDCNMALGTLQSLHFQQSKPYTCTTRINQ